jgi:hypothetical protein
MANKYSRFAARWAPKVDSDRDDLRAYVAHLAGGGTPQNATGELARCVGNRALTRVAGNWLAAAKAETEMGGNDMRSIRGRLPWQQLPPMV